jgi:hypothetical protein
LPVDSIRAINVPASPQVALDVVWSKLFQEGTELPDPRPGAGGHAGIMGLLRPPGMEKSIYKTLRVRFADLANQDLKVFR